MNQPTNENQSKPKSQPSKRRKQVNNYARYSGMGIQMGVIIAIGAYIGQQIDHRIAPDAVYWTAGLSLLGVIASIYLLLKDLANPDNK